MAVENSRKSEEAASSMKLEMEFETVADLAMNKVKTVISLLGRSRIGHARFRRAPVAPPPPPLGTSFSLLSNRVIELERCNEEPDNKIYCPKPINQVPSVGAVKQTSEKTVNFSYSQAISGANSFSQASSAAKLPPSYLKRKCSTLSENVLSGKCSETSGQCHCSKRRKQRVKMVIRVPAIGTKISDLTPDNHSWRKYGQKPIKGSPYPRGYYKCSSVKGCPARKRVERALDEPTMLIVTYEGDHNHSLSIAQTNSLILESSLRAKV